MERWSLVRSKYITNSVDAFLNHLCRVISVNIRFRMKIQHASKSKSVSTGETIRAIESIHKHSRDNVSKCP